MIQRLWRSWCISAIIVTALYWPQLGVSQGSAYERTFPQTKSTVERALQQLRPSMSGRLPALEGFASQGNHPLNEYRRGFYQVSAEVKSTASGGSVVHLNTKVTAWYTDSAGGHSGYQLLTSNGRLEADLLDQLSDQLALEAPGASITAPEKTHNWASSKPTSNQGAGAEPSAPMPRLPETGTFSASLSQNLAAHVQPDSRKPASSLPDTDNALQAEAANLEEILKNQAHPKNLVAVKKSGTAVVPSPSLSAKPLFLASAHDEFEMLNFNRDWVHVRISGLSRGWIWRDSLELPDTIPDADPAVAPAMSPAAELFHVSREETAPFPGDWEPLRGKSVKILSVEKTDDSAKDDSAQLKLAFARSLLDQSYAELAKKSDALAGIVVIFDSADGGMIAATLSSLQQWKAGRLSDAALWHQCFFDPPETFVSSGTAGSK